MTTKKKEASVKQKTTTTEAAEYTPPEEKVSVFSINMEIKDLILGQSKNAMQQYTPKDEQIESIRSSLYLSPAARGEDNNWNTPILDIAKLLMRSGVPSDHLRVSLITLLTLLSAHLNNHIELELIDEAYAGADNILRICTSLTPQDFLINLSRKITFETLLAEKDNLKGRAIVGFDSVEFEKVKEKINLLLKNQSLVDESTIQTMRGSLSQRVVIEGPTACVLMTRNSKKLILNDPSFLKCYLQPSSLAIADVSGLSPKERAKLTVDYNNRKANLGRLQHQDVKIPYREQIIQHLEKTKIALGKFETLMRMLSLITIINKYSPIGINEFVSSYGNTDPATVALAYDIPVIPKIELTADKVDYYIFWILMSGFIQNEEVFLTEQQKRIFEVVKNYNLLGLASLTMNNPNDSKYEKLNAIATENSPAQISQEQLLVEINKDGGEEIKSGTLYNNIQILLKSDVIGVKKYSSLNKNGYFVKDLEISDTIRFPHPAEIDHPAMKEIIKIRNPLTGEIDEV